MLKVTNTASQNNGEARSVKLFLFAAGLSFLLSVSLWFYGLRDEGVFVGIWVPSILALGSLVILAKRSSK
ncbi:MAG: hypothetical protein NT107_00335 [Planctomycetota bacterium]|nr:hypothetical protein [Planctomycetota bacterium]